MSVSARKNEGPVPGIEHAERLTPIVPADTKVFSLMQNLFVIEKYMRMES